MKLFPIRGGIHPAYRKELASECPIVALPMPKLLTIPLQQHIGAPADALVAEGDRVKKGQLIARGRGMISASHHAPTSGRVVQIGDIAGAHPSGLPQPTIVIEADGKDEWAELPAPIEDPFACSPRVIQERVADSGIVGMGGAAFPSAVKLDLGLRYTLDTLVLNGAECEPYLSCDDRVMREFAAEVVDGARIMAHALQIKKVIIAIEDNKPQAIAAVREAAAKVPDTTVATVPVQYPMGSEKHLVQAVTGRETPARKLTADLGVVVHNVATARAVHQAVRFGRPLIARIVTVSGAAVSQPSNLEVPLGAPVNALIEFCGGFSGTPKHLVNGGPMMGQPLPSLEAPVLKGTSGILALSAAEVNEQAQRSCIRCGACVNVCPCGLVPLEMAAYIRADKLDGAAKLGVGDCMSCGSCSWVCPSHLPLVHYFNYAKGALAAEAREQRKIDQTRTRAELRTQRLERLEAERQAAAAARKAARQGGVGA